MKSTNKYRIDIPLKSKDIGENKAYECIFWRYRIYPTKEQKVAITRSIDARNATYNFLLAKRENDMFDNLVSSMKELGLENDIVYNNDKTLCKKPYLKMTYKAKILEKVCKNNDIDYPTKEYTKNKGEENEETFSVLDISKTQKLLKSKKIYKGYDEPMLDSYTSIYDSTETAREHFSMYGCYPLGTGKRDLETAFNNFFNSNTNAGYPTFKKRSSERDELGFVVPNKVSGSFIIDKRDWKIYRDNANGNINDKYVFIVTTPQIGQVKVRYHRPFPNGSYLSRIARIVKTTDGFYYIVFSLYRPKEETKKEKSFGKAIGIDMSLSNDYIYIDSNGNHKGHVAFSKEIERLENHKKELQQQQSLKEINSKNYQKLEEKINKLTNKITRKRRYELESLAKELISNNDIVCIEDLNVASMKKKPRMVDENVKVTEKDLRECLKYRESDMRNPEFQYKLRYKAQLRRKLQSVNLGEFGKVLEEEALKQNKTLVKVGKFYPSSQICSNCGNRDEKYGGLDGNSLKTYECKKCGFVCENDINASINILNEGLRLLQEA